jgi:hypothetical protein
MYGTLYLTLLLFHYYTLWIFLHDASLGTTEHNRHNFHRELTCEMIGLPTMLCAIDLNLIKDAPLVPHSFGNPSVAL